MINTNGYIFLCISEIHQEFKVFTRSVMLEKPLIPLLEEGLCMDILADITE